mmetsp:Transcript_14713/g.22132  ORF Transcript_14713/g.22132 Transcript_14713/m.22132 type:complete len:230 (-) Transcript_14713:162-851(-)
MSNKPLFSTYVEPLQDKDTQASGTGSNSNYNNAYDNENDDDDMKYTQQQDAAAPTSKASGNKKITADEFKKFDISHLVNSDDDNFDIAKRICMFFDDKFGDKNTVALVAETGKFPAISYWLSGDYLRKHENMNGKHVMVYKACKHIAAKEPIVSPSEFEKYMKRISIEHEQDKCVTIMDIMDEKFGEGCHYARSLSKGHAGYEIYARFSDDYDAAFKLESGAYVTAWRR